MTKRKAQTIMYTTLPWKLQNEQRKRH